MGQHLYFLQENTKRVRVSVSRLFLIMLPPHKKYKTIHSVHPLLSSLLLDTFCTISNTLNLSSLYPHEWLPPQLSLHSCCSHIWPTWSLDTPFADSSGWPILIFFAQKQGDGFQKHYLPFWDPNRESSFSLSKYNKVTQQMGMMHFRALTHTERKRQNSTG